MINYFSIRIVIPVITLVLVLISLVTAYVSSRSVAHEKIVNTNIVKLHNRLNLLQGVAEQFLQHDLNESLQEMVANIASEPDLGALVFTDENGIILASNLISNIGKHWSNTELQIEASKASKSSEQRLLLVNVNKHLNGIKGYNGVCKRKIGALSPSNKCGLIYYYLDLNYHNKVANMQLFQQSLTIGTEAGIAALLLIYLLSVLISKPATEIKNGLIAFGHGDRNVKIEHHGNNEIAQLSRSLNEMFVQIQLTERNLHEKEQRLQSLFDSVADAVVSIDEQGIIDNINPATEKLFGYQRSELIGKNVKILMPEPYFSNHDSYLAHHIKTGDTKLVGLGGRETEGKRKDNSVFPMHLSVSRMHFNGKNYFTGIIKDITDSRKLQDSLLKVNDQLMNANLELHKSAITDGLTGLYNRKHFDLKLGEEIRRACRARTPLSLIICDIDHFKQYNDFYGHQAGDDCLRTVAKTFNEIFQRAGELPARYGGEEFVVLLPGLDLLLAQQRAEMLRQSVWEKFIRHAESALSDRVTLSIGIASYRPDSHGTLCPNESTLLEIADQALYKAKKQGRNKVVVGKDIS